MRLAEVNPTDYNNAIELSSRGHTILLKREPCECNVNPYNPSVLLAWGANMDLQPVLNAYSCVMYIASYIMKAEKSMGQLLKSVTQEVMGEELRSQLKKIGTAFLSHRELGAQEAVYRILSLPLKMLSRSVVYVDSNTNKERIGVLKDDPFLVILDENDTNVFLKSLINRYQHRPHSLQNIRFKRFHLETVPSKWYMAKIILYYPWYNEDNDLLGNYSS